MRRAARPGRAARHAAPGARVAQTRRRAVHRRAEGRRPARGQPQPGVGDLLRLQPVPLHDAVARARRARPGHLPRPGGDRGAGAPGGLHALPAPRYQEPDQPVLLCAAMILRLLLVWLINAVALIAVAYLMPSIAVASFGTALVAALVLGLINAVVRPVLVLLTLPVTILTLGLFIFVLNGLLFWMVGNWLQGFTVAGFWAGVFGAILFSLVSWALSALLLR